MNFRNIIIYSALASLMLLLGCGEAREIIIEPEPVLLRGFITTDFPSYPQYNPQECWTDSAWNINISLHVINIYDETLEDIVVPSYNLEVWRNVDTTLVKTLNFNGVLDDTIRIVLQPGDSARIDQISPIFWFKQLTDEGVGLLTPPIFEFANPFDMTIRGRLKFFDRAESVEIDPYDFRIFYRWSGCP